MFERLFYQEKEVFLQTLHTCTALVYTGVLLTVSLLFPHPVYIAGTFLVAAAVIASARAFEAWAVFLKAGVWMVFLIMLINAFLARVGATLIWSGPMIPVLGRLEVSLEAVCYGAVMGVRLLVLVSVFCLFNFIVHPDRVLGLFSRLAYQSTLVVALAVRMFPVMLRDLNNIREVQQARGMNFAAPDWKERSKNYAVLWKIMLMTSLEGALQIAEAMQARAFGSGPRSCYRRETWRPRDFICLAGSFLVLVAAFYARVQGFGEYEFYPYMAAGPFGPVPAAVIFTGLMLPVILSWGWSRCRYLHLKI